MTYEVPRYESFDSRYWGCMRILSYDTPVESEEASADIAEVPGLFENMSQSLRPRYRMCTDVGCKNFEQLLYKMVRTIIY